MFRRGNPSVLWPTQVRCKWIAAGCAFAMTTKVTRHAPKLSLRGETFVSTRQSICTLANSGALQVDRRRLRLRDDDQSDAVPNVIAVRVM